MNWSWKSICYWFFAGLMAIASLYCLIPLLLLFALQPSFLTSEPRMTAFYLLTGGACLIFFLVLIQKRHYYSFRHLTENREEKEPSIILTTDSTRNPVRLDDGSLSNHRLKGIYSSPGEYQIIIFDQITDEEVPFDLSRTDHRALKEHLDLYLRNYKNQESVLH